MVNAVRSTGATNVIMLGGEDGTPTAFGTGYRSHLQSLATSG
jgi:hypothetical protein